MMMMMAMTMIMKPNEQITTTTKNKDKEKNPDSYKRKNIVRCVKYWHSFLAKKIVDMNQ